MFSYFYSTVLFSAVVPSVMLDTQYRMHPMISHFPSHEFYDFGLRNGTVDASGAVAAHLHPPNFSLLPHIQERPNRPSVVFLDHRGAEMSKSRSIVNVTEAHLVCSIIEDLLLQNEVSHVPKSIRTMCSTLVQLPQIEYAWS